MICCATLILALKLAWTALTRGPALALAASGRSCHATARPNVDRAVMLEVGTALGLLLLLCGAIGQMVFGQSPAELFTNLHQFGCFAHGRGGPS